MLRQAAAAALASLSQQHLRCAYVYHLLSNLITKPKPETLHAACVHLQRWQQLVVCLVPEQALASPITTEKAAPPSQQASSMHTIVATGACKVQYLQLASPLYNQTVHAACAHLQRWQQLVVCLVLEQALQHHHVTVHGHLNNASPALLTSAMHGSRSSSRIG
jgi:hypothetical protein